MRLAKVEDYFEVCYGVSMDLNKLELSNFEKGIPYVGRSEKNNGVTAYVKKKDSLLPNPKNTISVAGSGSVLSTFVQEEEYYSGYHLFVLKPKFHMNLNELLFYATALRKHRFRYSYGRQANKTLKSLTIPHYTEIPIEVKNFNYDNLDSIQEYKKIYKYIKKEISKVNINNLVNLEDIFEIKSGLSSNNVTLQESREDGLIPYVRPSKWQSTSYAGFLNPKLVKEDKIFPPETLYISTDGAGSHSYTYVSIESFVPNSNVSILIPKKELSLEKKLMYATFITANRYKFSYGRKPKGYRLRKIRIPNF
ncbi:MULTISPECIES: restriction endonuclease subunit S [Staphylococcus]|uniref:restriction endonuclease subunit S n=2 Tax=Staphylococcus TaxID=1279 RepID=UPI0011A95313|nr:MULTISPECIES: restriction endonuclease subunit S [Staphylococcus]MCZ4237546.1 restriction endonuclease subunit S [Staphylococcus equorum]